MLYLFNTNTYSMADPLELNHNDYRAFVAFCEGCTGTFAIRSYIDERIKKYKGSNDDMIISLMEKVEERYPDIDYNHDDPNPIYKWEILNFKDGEHPKWIKRPHLMYLYSYLCFLCENQNEVNKIIGIEENGLPVDPDNSFNTEQDKKNLSDLYAHLVKYEFVEKRLETEFLKIFSNEPLKDINAIRWLGKYKNGADMQTLFEVIKHLCSWEYKRVPKQRIFFDKINSCFKRYDGEDLGINNIETNFSRWDKDNATSKILSATGLKSNKYHLIEYLKKFPLK